MKVRQYFILDDHTARAKIRQQSRRLSMDDSAGSRPRENDAIDAESLDAERAAKKSRCFIAACNTPIIDGSVHSYDSVIKTLTNPEWLVGDMYPSPPEGAMSQKWWCKRAHKTFKLGHEAKKFCLCNTGCKCKVECRRSESGEIKYTATSKENIEQHFDFCEKYDLLKMIPVSEDLWSLSLEVMRASNSDKGFSIVPIAAATPTPRFHLPVLDVHVGWPTLSNRINDTFASANACYLNSLLQSAVSAGICQFVPNSKLTQVRFGSKDLLQMLSTPHTQILSARRIIAEGLEEGVRQKYMSQSALRNVKRFIDDPKKLDGLKLKQSDPTELLSDLSEQLLPRGACVTDCILTQCKCGWHVEAENDTKAIVLLDMPSKSSSQRLTLMDCINITCRLSISDKPCTTCGQPHETCTRFRTDGKRHLIFALKRFSHDGQSKVEPTKNNASVVFPDELLLDDAHLHEPKQVTSGFRLRSLIKHIGQIGSGHYIAYGTRPKINFDGSLHKSEREWMTFDDEHANRLQNRSFGECYIAWYTNDHDQTHLPGVSSTPP